MGGKFVWFPTVSAPSIEMDWKKIEEIVNIAAENDMVLLTGHLKPDNILDLIDIARSLGVLKTGCESSFNKSCRCNIG